MLRKIGRYDVTKAKGFFFDGCHKIYIVEDNDDIAHFLTLGYNMDDFHVMDEIEDIYIDACPLKFINNCKLTKTYARQFQKIVSFEYDSYINRIRN